MSLKIDTVVMVQQKRPPVLTFICILSFIGSGLTALSNLFVYVNYNLVMESLQSMDFDLFEFDPALFLAIKRPYFILTGLLAIFSFLGVKRIWNLQKIGLHMYAIAQILLLIVSSIHIYRPIGQIPIFDLMLTTLFILMYLRFKEIMN